MTDNTIQYRGRVLNYTDDVLAEMKASGIDLIAEMKAAVDNDLLGHPMTAEIYTKTKTHCGYCVRAKALLEKHQIPYREISLEENRDECIDRVREATGAEPKTAPQIFIDGRHVGGHDDLVKFLGA
jgi:glutaredoxin 3